MTRHVFLLLLFCIAGHFTAAAQKNANIGLYAGVAYYMGDINPNRHFYKPAPAFGALYRYNVNSRYAIRASGLFTSLSGNDLDFPEILHPDRPVSPASFTTTLIDAALVGEFDFLPFYPGTSGFSYTPFISAGLAGTLIVNTDRNAYNTLTIPFSLGVKVNLSKRITAGTEWSFRKAFSDRIDGLENPAGIHSMLHNNDWYSFAGVFITYKFFNFAADCPAYQ
jgi:hypothetical protein